MISLPLHILPRSFPPLNNTLPGILPPALIHLPRQRLDFCVPTVFEQFLRSRLCVFPCRLAIVFCFKALLLLEELGRGSSIVCAYRGANPLEGLGLLTDGISLGYAVCLVDFYCHVED